MFLEIFLQLFNVPSHLELRIPAIQIVNFASIAVTSIVGIKIVDFI